MNNSTGANRNLHFASSVLDIHKSHIVMTDSAFFFTRAKETHANT